MSITVTPLAGALGAEIGGFDVHNPADEMPAVLDALHEFGVVFVRNAALTPKEQVELGRCFGSPSLFPITRILGATKPVATEISDSPDSPPKADYWHTDATWMTEPPAYALLQSTRTCERGGDTLWASGGAIYDALSPALQDFVCDLTVRHTNESLIRGTIDKMGEEEARKFDLENRLRTEYPPVVHPLVRSHPVTGRRTIFWGGRFMDRIVELEPSESTALLQLIATMLDDARFHVRWHWQEGDLAIWDEAQTMHRSAGDHAGQHRSVRRVEIDGTRPFLDEIPHTSFVP